MKHHQQLSSLTEIKPFDRFTERELAPLAQHVDRINLRDGATVARAGESVREFLVVLRGEVRAFEGHQVEALGPGTELGGDELLSGATHPRTLVAGSDVELLVVNGPAYRWAAQVLPRLHSAA